jgi:hypothetical protein
MMSNHHLNFFKDLRNGQAIQLRLHWLEDRVFWVGELNRSDLVTRFEISSQQASADIKLYSELAPTNLCYDRSRKQYSRGESFNPLFGKDFEKWLALNKGEAASLRSIQSEVIKPLKREIPRSAMAAVTRAYRQRKPIQILYQSMKNDAPSWRTICPHTLVSTDIRWHIRAWMAEKGKFIDIVPSRILEVKDAPGQEWVGESSDADWNEMVEIALVPSSKFSVQQQEVIRRDFHMIDGRKIILTRACLVYYQLSAMYLVDAVRQFAGEPEDRNLGIAVANWRDLVRYVKDSKSA